MLCKAVRNKRVWWGLIIIGLLSVLFGVVTYRAFPSENHSFNMLMGMFTGCGSVFVVIGAMRLIYLRVASPEKLKKEEIEGADERNLQILRSAHTIANSACAMIFVVLAFVFVGLGYRTPAFIAIGALYLQQGIFFIAYKYYSKKI